MREKERLTGRGPPVIQTEAGGDLAGPEDDGAILSKLGLEVAGDEAMEDGVGDEENQPDSDNGVGVMVEGMVGVPRIDDFIESLVFDLPSGVTEANDGGGGDLFLGQRRDPGPMVDLHGGSPLVGDTFSHRGGFYGANHTDRMVQACP